MLSLNQCRGNQLPSATTSMTDTPVQTMAMFDRAWLPNLAAERTWDRRLANSPAVSRRSPVPAGFPESIDAEMAWTGAQFQGQPGLYRYELNEEQVAELENAATEVEGNPPGYAWYAAWSQTKYAKQPEVYL